MSSFNKSINGKRVSDDFYSKRAIYWSKIEPTIDGMLGGYPQVSPADFRGSRQFLQRYLSPLKTAPHNEKRRALDVGSGIGRVTKGVLLDFADTVDLVDFNQIFLDEARNHIGPDTFDKRVGYTFCEWLQEFTPLDDIDYDLIWCQWVCGYLTDDHFIKLLIRCKNSLKRNGLIIVKDNHTCSLKADYRVECKLVTRPRWLLLEIFNRAGLRCVASARQTSFPRELYPVRIFALRDETH